MRRLIFSLTACIFLCASLSAQTTPNPISMSSSLNNNVAFGSNGFLGSNGATFYLHWDATYLYFGWDGGNTNWSGSDLYFIGIDTNNDQGASSGLEGIGYTSNVFDYYLVYENSCAYYGPWDACGGNQGNSFELWKVNSSGGWSWIDRRNGNDNTQSKTLFGTPGETRFRIAWTDISFSPGPGNPIAFTFWTNNHNLSYVWGSWPSSNPGLGTNPYVISNKLVFSSTGNGVDPSSDGVDQPLAFVLPIELLNFHAGKKASSVLMEWSTAMETNSSHFDIQHSSNGIVFNSLSRIEASGESTIVQHYEFEDENPVLGSNYYRLCHFDYDGTTTYSEVVSVYFGNEKNIQVFPNPVKDYLEIKSTDGKLIESIEIYDVQGRLIEDVKLSGPRGEIIIDTEEWRSGVYQLLINLLDGEMLLQNIIK
jgi:hypothetical protein